eukprot:7346475-Pyramimonas_sp.AAC.1
MVTENWGRFARDVLRIVLVWWQLIAASVGLVLAWSEPGIGFDQSWFQPVPLQLDRVLVVQERKKHRHN